LISLGAISFLGKKIEPKKDENHTFDHPIKDVCIFYHRDRNENLLINNFKNITERENYWINYFDSVNAGFNATYNTQRNFINEDIKKKIREKNNCKFEQIVIIAEADNWTLDEKIEYMPNPDPLVVGVRGDLAYLIEKFDVTRIEEYVSKEFLE
jgi:hypothetical protein